MTKIDFTQIPKAELHCHLDGSLDIDTSLELLKAQGRQFSREDIVKEMTVSEGCTSLDEYLQKFTLPISILQTEEELTKSTYGVLKNAHEDGVEYIEIRFAPSWHKAKGLNYRQIIEAVKLGCDKGKEDFKIDSGIIACAMRHLSVDENLEMFKTAREMLGCGIVAVDLAGGEVGHPMKDHVELFREAKRMELPFTIHAGEQSNFENVRGAVELGARRIGHGITAINDKALVALLADKKVCLEMCPTSNLQTKAVASIEQYPLLQFMDAKIPVTLNTDNRTVSGITLSSEYELIAEKFGLTERDFKEIYEIAMNYKFK